MRVVAIVLALFDPLSSAAAYFTYSQWAALPPGGRARYIAGAFDSLVGFAADENETLTNVHYSDCIGRANMNDYQLAENIVDYVATRPELQVGSVQGAMIDYLIAACGRPPSPPN